MTNNLKKYIWKNIFWTKIAISLSKGHLKGRPSYSLQPQKEHPAHPKKKFINFFLFLYVIFVLLDPGSEFGSGSRDPFESGFYPDPDTPHFQDVQDPTGSGSTTLCVTLIINVPVAFPCTAHSTKTQPDEVFKGAQVWDFWPIFFYTNKSYIGWWLEDWRRKKIFSKLTADIRHFGFFTQAEPALKNFLRRLSLRLKVAYAGWACANNLPTQAEPALKKSVNTGKKFTHTEPALTICPRRLSLR
jgi:hypothetical protein